MKDFVTYEQALELAKLNFNEKCFGYYGLENELYIEISCNLDSNLTRRNFIAAPTFSQAFRWFREKHDLHSCVAPVYEDEISKVIVYWFWIQGFDSFEDEDINYKTPEEAELNCLLKLIEIVKTKNI